MIKLRAPSRVLAAIAAAALLTRAAVAEPWWMQWSSDKNVHTWTMNVKAQWLKTRAAFDDVLGDAKDVKKWSKKAKAQWEKTREAFEEAIGDAKEKLEGFGQGFGQSFACPQDGGPEALHGELREASRQLTNVRRELKTAEGARSRFHEELSECRVERKTADEEVRKRTSERDVLNSKLATERGKLEEARARIATLAAERDAKPHALPRSSGSPIDSDMFGHALPAMLIALALGLPLCLAVEWYERLSFVFEGFPSRSKVRDLQCRIEALQAQLDTEVGETTEAAEEPMPLHADFEYTTFDTVTDEEIKRTVKIQCTGVGKGDIHVKIIRNGCIVTIERGSAPGVEAMTWTKKFQFRQSEGCFEFKEDEASLERGYLQFVFRNFPHRERVFRFPPEYDMAATDWDISWNDLPPPQVLFGSSSPNVGGPPPTETLAETLENAAISGGGAVVDLGQPELAEQLAGDVRAAADASPGLAKTEDIGEEHEDDEEQPLLAPQQGMEPAPLPGGTNTHGNRSKTTKVNQRLHPIETEEAEEPKDSKQGPSDEHSDDTKTEKVSAESFTSPPLAPAGMEGGQADGEDESEEDSSIDSDGVSSATPEAVEEKPDGDGDAPVQGGVDQKEGDDSDQSMEAGSQVSSDWVRLPPSSSAGSMCEHVETPM